MKQQTTCYARGLFHHLPSVNQLPNQLDDRVARKQVGGREQIEGKKSEVTEDE